ncbi:MAG TPA: transglycosylase family protein [Solirubrobacterales bacterium]|nr:transglycosylase family protein [Solirubrobacterales bacterium]
MAFPVAALASTDPGDGSVVAVSDAEVAPLGLGRPAGEQFERSIDVAVARIAARKEAEAAKRQREREERFADLPGGVSMATLESIAACESGGDPHVVSADGTYRGKYQFDYGTWESVGGHGDPAAAPEAEQDYRAALLYVRSGSSPWPVCG